MRMAPGTLAGQHLYSRKADEAGRSLHTAQDRSGWRCRIDV